MIKVTVWTRISNSIYIHHELKKLKVFVHLQKILHHLTFLLTNYFGVALMVMWEVFISKDKAVKYIKTHL